MRIINENQGIQILDRTLELELAKSFGQKPEPKEEPVAEVHETRTITVEDRGASRRQETSSRDRYDSKRMRLDDGKISSNIFHASAAYMEILYRIKNFLKKIIACMTVV